MSCFLGLQAVLRATVASAVPLPCVLERESSVTRTLVGVGIATWVQGGTLVQPSITAAEVVADAQEGAVVKDHLTNAGAAISVGFAADAWVMYSF
jgi:hypothetical protein